MLIHVGSQNKVKVAAVTEVIADYPDLAGAQVVGFDVDSGIADQPLSLDEMFTGATNRAHAAYTPDCDYAIGLESGLFPVPGTSTGYMDAGACVIFDGKKVVTGLSSAWELPPEALRLVLEEEMDMSQAINATGLTDDPNIGSEQGAIGILTKGRIDRKEYTKESIAKALIQLEFPHLYK